MQSRCNGENQGCKNPDFLKVFFTFIGFRKKRQDTKLRPRKNIPSTILLVTCHIVFCKL